jgi:hypothetical protein
VTDRVENDVDASPPGWPRLGEREVRCCDEAEVGVTGYGLAVRNAGEKSRRSRLSERKMLPCDHILLTNPLTQKCS